MEQLKSNKANIVDLATIVVVLLLLAMGSLYYLRKPMPEDTRLSVVVEISDPAQVKVITNAARNDKSVYFNSINVPLVVSKAIIQGQNLEITLVGPGYVKDEDFFFSGQRILIGQKAEIHASYFAQGKIIKIENAN